MKPMFEVTQQDVENELKNRELRPHSSERAEQRLIKSEAPESRTGEGSLSPSTWWHYVLVRKELSGGAAMAQACHAAAYSANNLDKRTIPDRTRMCILSASKEQMQELLSALELFSDEIGITLEAFKESEGELAGVITSIAFLTSDKEKVKALLAELKPWRK